MTSLAAQFEALIAEAKARQKRAKGNNKTDSWIFYGRVADALAALRSAPPVQEGWRGIETAPRDGTQFLAALSNGWIRIIWAFADDFTGNYRWWHSESNGLCTPPIVETHPADTNWAKTNTVLATHWRPLPAAPEPTGVSPTGECGACHGTGETGTAYTLQTQGYAADKKRMEDAENMRQRCWKCGGSGKPTP